MEKATRVRGIGDGRGGARAVSAAEMPKEHACCDTRWNTAGEGVKRKGTAAVLTPPDVKIKPSI